MKRGDRVMFLLFAVLVLMSAAVWLRQNYILPDGAAAEVLQNGHVIKKIDLRKANGEEYRFASHGCVNLVRAEHGKNHDSPAHRRQSGRRMPILARTRSH